MLYSFRRYNFLRTEFSTRIACWALRSRCSRRSRSLWVCGEWLLIPSLYSLSVLQRFPDYTLSLLSIRRAKSPWKHCGNPALYGALACDFREVGDTVVWTVDGIVHGSFLIELLELITCVENGLGQVAKLLVAGAEVRLTRAFGSGKFGKIVRTGASVRLVSKCQVKEQQDKKKTDHESGDMRMQQTPFSWPWAMRVCDTHENVRMCAMNALCAEKCACNRWVRVHHPSHTQYLLLRG